MACWASEKLPEINAWDAMIAATVDTTTTGYSSVGGRQRVERVGDDPLAAGEHRRTLAEVVEEQAREDHEVPGEPDRSPAEVPHVGVQRLGARDAQHHGGQDRRSRGPRATTRKSRPCQGSTASSTRGSRSTHGTPSAAIMPNQTSIAGPNTEPTTAVPRFWISEEADQDRQRDGDDERLEPRRRHLEALDRSEHGDHRGDHAVGQEQRGADQGAEHEPHRAPIHHRLVPWAGSAPAAP